ncbi:lipid II:glycine glycyltransferase FemX [Actinomyces culturomici]|uniref:lipid II:glycine glycyltransferase FemX n=1 Tax=Actinomyces culturomici TaxID=1926276 RepID=UPI00135C07C9|nr:GNAT family N-acetyltransferase [Actinomyces culturomici]
MTDSSWTLRRSDADEVAAALAAAGVDSPIEQTPQWASFDESDSDRTSLGYFLVSDDSGVDRASFLATRVNDHGTRFVWLRHGPVWFSVPAPDDESALVTALVTNMKAIDAGATHLRLDLASAPEGAMLPGSLITYDSTVVIDTSISSPDLDDDAATEEILARFKPRGRRDVRKSVRESGLECADETEAATADFEPYHAVMRQTAERDGFVPWPAEFYQRMLSDLGPERARLFAGRIDGEVVCWSIVCLSGRRAWRYCAASKSEVMRLRVTDRLVLFECLDLARRGVVAFDLMGIGSDIAPSLGGLNEFKTKFSKEVVAVAPAREIVLRPWVYFGVQRARRILHSIRH